MSRGKFILMVCGGLVLAALCYFFGLGTFIKWGEHATTKSEYIRRVQVRNKIYAPVIWLKIHDPTGGVTAVVQWQYRLCHDAGFNPDRLPW